MPPIVAGVQGGSSNVRQEFKRMVLERIDVPKAGSPSTLPGQVPPSAAVPNSPGGLPSIPLQNPGGGLLTTTPPSGSSMLLSASFNKTNVVAANSHMTSHMMSRNQDNDVFSPTSTDDEHMKHLEKVWWRTAST